MFIISSADIFRVLIPVVKNSWRTIMVWVRLWY